MGILRCDECGDDFVIYHSPAFVNKSVADRQAYWLEKVLAEEHERDKKHPDRIELPDWSESERAEGSKWLTKLFDVHIACWVTASGRCCSAQAGLSASSASMWWFPMIRISSAPASDACG